MPRHNPFKGEPKNAYVVAQLCALRARAVYADARLGEIGHDATPEVRAVTRIYVDSHVLPLIDELIEWARGNKSAAFLTASRYPNSIQGSIEAGKRLSDSSKPEPQPNEGAQGGKRQSSIGTQRRAFGACTMLAERARA